jgi:hypothetical protein
MSGGVLIPQRPTGSNSAARLAPPSAWFIRAGGAGRFRIPRALTGEDAPASFIARLIARSAPAASPSPTGVALEATRRALCLGSSQGVPDMFLAPPRGLSAWSARPVRAVSPYDCLAGSVADRVPLTDF